MNNCKYKFIVAGVEFDPPERERVVSFKLPKLTQYDSNNSMIILNDSWKLIQQHIKEGIEQNEEEEE